MPPKDNFLLSFQSDFPLAAKYDANWVVDNMMGPNALWLAESLSQVMDLRPGMRVLDMGCGKALSSIFFAQEFGVDIWAADLWIRAEDNVKRIQEAALDRSPNEQGGEERDMVRDDAGRTLGFTRMVATRLG